MSEQETQVQNQEQEKQKPAETTPAEKPLTKKELEALLQAQRAEVEAERKKREELEKQLKAVSDRVESVDKSKLDAPKPVQADPTPADGEKYLLFLQEKQAAKLKELEEASKKFQEKQESELERMKQEYRSKELALHRKALLSDVPTQLHDLVVGKDEAELDAAKVRVKALENELREKLKQEVSREVVDKLPKPRNPSVPQGTPTNRPKSARELREQIAKDPHSFRKAFEAQKQELLSKLTQQQ